MSSSAVTTDATPQSGTGFVKAMTLTDATMLVAGSMIGSGIFIVSADIARGAAVAVLADARLGRSPASSRCSARSPTASSRRCIRSAGGQYVFLRESMGPLMGFLYGWTLLHRHPDRNDRRRRGRVRALPRRALVPAITPDRFAWFPQPTSRRALAPVRRTRSSSASRRSGWSRSSSSGC